LREIHFLGGGGRKRGEEERVGEEEDNSIPLYISLNYYGGKEGEGKKKKGRRERPAHVFWSVPSTPGGKKERREKKKGKGGEEKD